MTMVKDPEATSPWMTRNQAAQYLQVHPETISRLVAAGKLRRFQSGKQQRYTREDLDTYLKTQA